MVDPAFAALVVGLYGVSERGTLPRVDSDDPDADEAGSDDPDADEAGSDDPDADEAGSDDPDADEAGSDDDA